MTDLFDAIFGYYMVALGAGAFNGARATLRTAHGKGSSAADAAKFASGDDSGSGGSFDERGRRLGERAARKAQMVRRSRAAADVADIAGWVSGVRLYRAAARGAADATERVLARRNGGAEDPDGPTTAAPDSESAPTLDETPAAAGPNTQPATVTEPAAESVDGDDLDALARAVTAPQREPDTDPAPTTGRPTLTLVPPIKEYPEIMPAADITDLESLLGFTGQAAGFAGMEAEDAIAASASTIAAAEFSSDTARRVDEETQTVEHAIAAMTLLGVDGETAAAYQQLHEAGGVYRDLANQFASGLQDLAALAQSMSGAASNYHEAAVAALETVTREQMPHAEAAQATGHGGADGHFYGVSSTQHVVLPNPTAGALPAGN